MFLFGDSKTDIPAGHILRPVHDATKSVMNAYFENEGAADAGDKKLIDHVIRCTLLEAVYGLANDPQCYEETVRHNATARSFVRWPAQTTFNFDRYEIFRQQLCGDGTLKLLLLRIEKALQGMRLEAAQRAADCLQRYIDDYLPEEVRLRQVFNDNVVELEYSLEFGQPERGMSQERFFEMAKTEFPDIVGHPEAGYELSSPKVHNAKLKASDYVYALHIDGPFEGLESFEGYAERFLLICQSAAKDAIVSNCKLTLKNEFQMPAECDIHQYFQMLPTPLPELRLPPIFDVDRENYKIPRRLEELRWCSTLEFSYIRPDKLSYEIRYSPAVEAVAHLDLHAQFTEDQEIANVRSTLGLLTVDILVGYNALISNKLRQLLQSALPV